MVTVYGHRGAKGEAPENTLAGFAHALGIGARALELDVRLSADDELIVMHDETVNRTTDGSGRVADLTVEQIRRLDARRSHPTWPERVAVPTLTEVLDAVTEVRGVTLRIEVKRDAPERLERVCRAVARAVGGRAFDDRVVVSSFEPLALELFRSAAPHLRRAFITSADPAGSIATATRLGCAEIDIRRTVLSSEVVAESHAWGLGVNGWLGNTTDELRHLLDCGVDKVTSDFPSLALRFVREASGA